MMNEAEMKKEEKKLKRREVLQRLWMSETKKIVDLVNAGTPLIVAQRQVRRGSRGWKKK